MKLRRFSLGGRSEPQRDLIRIGTAGLLSSLGYGAILMEWLSLAEVIGILSSLLLGWALFQKMKPRGSLTAVVLALAYTCALWVSSVKPLLFEVTAAFLFLNGVCCWLALVRQDRFLARTAAYCAVLGYSWAYFQLPVPAVSCTILYVIFQTFQINLFAITVWRCISSDRDVPERTVWYCLPLLLYFYFSNFLLLEQLMGDQAVVFSLAYCGVIPLVYGCSATAFSRDDHPTANMVHVLIFVVFLHAIYFRAFPPWLRSTAGFAVLWLLSRPENPFRLWADRVIGSWGPATLILLGASHSLWLLWGKEMALLGATLGFGYYFMSLGARMMSRRTSLLVDAYGVLVVLGVLNFAWSASAGSAN